MIYLAGPYSGREQTGFNFLTQYAAHLTLEGHFVFSPITMCHPMTDYAELPGDFKYWKEYDEKMIAFCDCLIVLTLDGWNVSKGVTAEIKIAERFGKRVHFRDIHDIPSGIPLSR